MTSRATFILFNALLLPLYPLLAAYTLWRRFVQKKSSASLHGQWGSVPREVLQALRPSANNSAADELRGNIGSREPVIWIHAVSVGEQMAARPIARALKDKIPGCRIAISVTTDTGFQAALSTVKAGEADAAFYFPLDLPVAVTRALKAIRPDVFLAVETELWPNFLHLARARGVLCLLVNGRVSDNLFARARKTKWLWSWLLSNLNGLLMRSEFDAERMQRIAAEVGATDQSGRITVLGDVKLDGLQELEKSPLLRKQWRSELGFDEEELLLIFGSTHPGEEEIALRVFQNLRERFTNLKMIVAPRHVERVDEVRSLFGSQEMNVVLRSAGKCDGHDVILLDTVGELSEVYAAADVAFVGGSLIPRGGHNVLEPVLRGVPVLFGPHVENFRSHAELVQNAGLGDRVQDEAELKEKAMLWLQDVEGRHELPARAACTLAPHQGAPERIAEHVATQLKLKGF